MLLRPPRRWRKRTRTISSHDPEHGRYSYLAGEDDRSIRTNSRYFRAPANGGDVNSGRGDEHHSIYGGLNWYLCGHKAKIMTGIEYETLDTNAGNGDVDAMTLWLAFRTYF